MGVHITHYTHTIRSVSHFWYSFLVSSGCIPILPDVNTLEINSIGGTTMRLPLVLSKLLSGYGDYTGYQGHSSLALFLCAVSYRQSIYGLFCGLRD